MFKKLLALSKENNRKDEVIQILAKNLDTVHKENQELREQLELVEQQLMLSDSLLNLDNFIIENRSE